MSRLLILTVLGLFVCLVPVQTFAAGHTEHQMHQESTFGDLPGHNAPDAMAVEGGMFIVGDMTSKGVRGMAHLKDVREAMSKLGQVTTHHFMIAFVDIETGEQLKGGTVALKVQDPDGKVSEPIELMSMQGHFGVDLVLDKQGEYHFKLGTQLADGVKRKYHFHHKID